MGILLGEDPRLLQQNLKITRFARLRRWQSALGLLEWGVLAAGLQPDQITFGAASTACQQAGVWSQAGWVLWKMQVLLLPPDEIAYSIRVDTYAKNARWQMAAVTVGNCKQALLAFCACCVVSCRRGGRKSIAMIRERSSWAHAIDGLEQLVNASVRLTVKNFGSSMATCMRQKQWQQPLRLLRDMNLSHPSPNLITFNSTISAFGMEHWHFALDLLSNLQNQRFVPDAFSYGATAAALQEGPWQRSLSLLEALKPVRSPYLPRSLP
ncbi:unnamed protein product [Symbiodinium sp. CCMP2456]|nr:unnamed protein product [Symbiodinium sp. CCMP2456]